MNKLGNLSPGVSTALLSTADTARSGVSRRPLGDSVERVERVKETDRPPKPVRIEEEVTTYFEREVVEKTRQYVASVVEEERRIPTLEVHEKVVEIPGFPHYIEKIVEVPQYVHETVLVPSTQPPIIQEIPKVVEEVVPRFTETLIEKVIQTPRRNEVRVPVVVPREQLVPGNLQGVHERLLVSDRVLPPVVRERGVVEVPVTRITPKVIPVDIIIPNKSMTEDQLTAAIMERVQYRIIKQDIVPIETAEERLARGEVLHVEEHPEGSSVNADIRSTEDGTGLAIEFQPQVERREFGTADYNSWLLALNQHLVDPRSFGFEQQDPNSLMQMLPYMRDPTGNVPFLHQGTPMIGMTLQQ